MGLQPTQIDQLSLWEFAWCANQFTKANNPDAAGGKGQISGQEEAELLAFMDNIPLRKE